VSYFGNQILINDEHCGNEGVVENPIVFPQPFNFTVKFFDKLRKINKKTF